MMSEARKGRGRPVIDQALKAKSYAVKLPPAVIETIKAKAAAARVSQARLIALAVEAFTPAPPSAEPAPPADTP